MTDSKIQNQSRSAIKREARLQNQHQKQFGGKLNDFKDNQERHFNQRMLKAYLRGDSKFQFGKSWQKNQLGLMEFLPTWYDVQLTDKTVDLKALDKLLANGYCDPGKVFGGVPIGKSKLRKIVHEREIKRLEKIKEDRLKKPLSL